MLLHIFIIILTTMINKIFSQNFGFCNKNNGSFETDMFRNKTILGFLDKESTNKDVRFQWKVAAKKNGTCTNIQRCNLIAKDAARTMEQYLKSIKFDVPSFAILIDNNRIVKGIDYTLNLIILEENNIREQKEFKIPSTIVETNNSINNLKKLETSLELKGSNTSFADLNYYITATISMCDLVNENVMLKWELLDVNKEKIKTFQHKGIHLKIPPKTFSPDNIYYMQCSLVLFNKTQLKKIHKIEILKREPNLKLNIKTLKVGKNQPIKLIASYESDEDNLGDLKWKWICKNNAEACKDFNETDKDILEIEKGFPEIGSYEIIVIAEANGVSKNTTSTIRVVEVGSRTIELNKMSCSVNPSRELEIAAKIYGLKVGCVAEWQSIEDEDYEYIDLSRIPEEVTNWNKSDDEVSNNITEETSNNLDFDFVLKIPPTKGSWKGLKGGKEYLLRLTSKCPTDTSSPINTFGDLDEIYSDILIKTNPTPKINQLFVTPEIGKALITMFTFSTESVRDEEAPFLYIFGYSINNKTVYFDKISECFSTETVLPYAENGVNTVLKVCNNKMSCVETNGPIIKLTLPENITSETDEYFTNTFNTDLMRGDYTTAFSHGIALLETYKFFNNDLQLENLEEIVINSVNQIYKMKISEEIMDEDFKTSISDLIENTKNLAKFIKISPRILNSLIKLRAKLHHELSANIVTKNKSINDMFSVLREINDKDISSVTFNDFREYLLTSEFIISQSSNKNIINSIKNNIIEYVRKNLGQLCFLLFSGEPIKVDLFSLSLQLDLVNWNYFSNYIYVPNYYSNSKLLIKFDQTWFNEIQSSKLCVAKGIFKDFFQRNDLFYVELFDADSKDAFTHDILQNFVILKGTTEQTCTVYSNNKWKICRKIKDSNNNILCSCENFGFYSVANYVNLSTSTDRSTDLQSNDKNIGNQATTTISRSTTLVNVKNKVKDLNNKHKDKNVNKINKNQNNNEINDESETIEQFGSATNDDRKTSNTLNVLVTTAIATKVNETIKKINTNYGTDNNGVTSSQSSISDNINFKLNASLQNTNDVGMLTLTNVNDNQTSEHIVINYGETTTSNNTPIIKSGSFLSAGEFKQSDQISLILIGISVFGMILVGIFGGIMNRIKRERTIEASEGVDFPKYADVFHKETMETLK